MIETTTVEIPVLLLREAREAIDSISCTTCSVQKECRKESNNFCIQFINELDEAYAIYLEGKLEKQIDPTEEKYET